MANPEDDVACANCGKNYPPSTSRRCPQCGHKPGSVVQFGRGRPEKLLRTDQAAAYFLKCLALLAFASVAGVVAAAVGFSMTSGQSWAFAIGGLIVLIFIFLAASAYSDGSSALRRGESPE